jgi:hypothetical protein
VKFVWHLIIALNIAAAIAISGEWLWRQLGGPMRLMDYAGFVIIPVLLWIRPEYRFLLFYVAANSLLVFFLSDSWRLTWAEAPDYAAASALKIAIILAFGAPLVAWFKWLKNRKTEDPALDQEMQRIRAELAANRDRSPT